MARKYLPIYHDMIPTIDNLSDAEAGRLIKSALKYSASGEAADLSGNERFIWPMFMAQIDREKERYEERCEINKRNAASRYESHRVAANRSQSQPIQEEKENKKSFTPPTLDEIRAYCKERNSSVDPQQFYDYFTAGNWIDSKGKPVLAWKQKIITWEKFNVGKETPVPAQTSAPDTSWRDRLRQREEDYRREAGME